jgi:hypothetical protein
LIEFPTIKKIRSNIDALTKGLTAAPKDDVVNKIRIELATLSCANRVEKYSIESAKQDLPYYNEVLAKKLVSLKDFDHKNTILCDIAKTFNSWITSTKFEKGHQVFTEKTVGVKYFKFVGDCLEKNQNEKIALGIMSNLSQGLGDRVNILAKASEDMRPRLTRSGTVIGINPDEDEEKINELSAHITKMMKQFESNNMVQNYGCLIFKYIAILSEKSRYAMNQSGVQKSMLSILQNDGLSKEAHENAIETLKELAKGDPRNSELIAKQKGLSCIFKSLKINNGDEGLSSKADDLIKKLMEHPEGKADLKENMIEKVAQLDNLVGKKDLSKEELKKASAAANEICSSLMNEDLADVSSDDGKKTVSNLKNFWSIRKKEEIILQSTGSREYKQDVINLARGAQRLLKSAKPGDTKAIENLKGSMLLEEAIRTFKTDHEDGEISLAVLKFINQFIANPDLKEYALGKCSDADLAAEINKSLELHKGNFDLMGEVINLAVELCLQYPNIAEKIDGRSLIKHLLDSGRKFQKNGIEEPKNMKNTKAVINCLKAFSKSEENLKIMEENQGKEYFRTLKLGLANVIEKKTTYNFATSLKRSIRSRLPLTRSLKNQK